MAEIRTQPVRAHLVDNIDEGVSPPGSFKFYAKAGETAGMLYICPCGCGRIGALAFRPALSPSWEWNGDRDAPTLSPSVNHVGHWHGFLRAGVWTSC